MVLLDFSIITLMLPQCVERLPKCTFHNPYSCTVLTVLLVSSMVFFRASTP